MAQNDESRLRINRSASDYALHAGQILERLLMDGGIENAQAAGESIVAVCHVAAAVKPKLVEEVIRRLMENSDGRADGKKANDPSVRRAA